MTRRLYRSRTDTVFSGVAAGVATYLNADPALVRIAWAILVPLTGGVALVAYIVASFVVQQAPAAGAAANLPMRRQSLPMRRNRRCPTGVPA